MIALVWSGVAFGCVLTLTASLVLGVRPALAHRKHERTLTNIERLEVELGYRNTERQLADLTQAIAYATHNDIVTKQKTADPPMSEWVLGDCALCHKRVALNAGYCQAGNDCAKKKYRQYVATHGGKP